MDKKKSIRILSYQNAQNFGALLQAYGLQLTFKQLGFVDVKFLNYNPKYLSDRYLVFKWRTLVPSSINPKHIIGHYINLPFSILNQIRRNYKLNLSRKRLIKQTSKELHTIDDIEGINCDCLVCGSDQIWSTWLTGSPDEVFYAGGKYNGKPYSFSYAPSTELSTFENEQFVETIKCYLDNFDSISVREESVQTILKKLTGKDISLCVDPTILCGTEAYDEISVQNEIGKKYILVYAYNNKDTLIQNIIKTIPNYHDFEIHYISFVCSDFRNMFSHTFHAEISVEQFVSLFKYADYVVTNSFHGLAFSLLFQKDFVVAYEQGKSARVESLLKQIGRLDKLVKFANDAKWEKMDYTDINKKLQQIRNNSRDFIIRNLSLI